MRTPTRALALPALLLAAALFAPLHAGAQQFPIPNKIITFIWPFGPGSTGEVLGRDVARLMGEHLGVPAVVETRPGAGGAIGSVAVVRAAPDGHTLLIHTNSITVDQAIKLKPAFDLRKDLRALAVMFEGPLAIHVNNDLPVNNVKELVAYAKANPGKLNYPHAGVGSYTHLMTEYFRSVAGIDIVGVPYANLTASAVATMSNQTQVMITDPAGTKPQWSAGKLRVIAVTSAQRSPFMPQVPTVIESGLPGYEVNYWCGFFAPSGVPEVTAGKLYKELSAALGSAEIKQRLFTLGYTGSNLTSEEFSKRVDAEIDEMKEVIAKNNIERQ